MLFDSLKVWLPPAEPHLQSCAHHWLCRPVVCWVGAMAESMQQAVRLGNNTWQQLATSAGVAVFVDTAGKTYLMKDDTPEQATSFPTNWRAASYDTQGFNGITHAGRLVYVDGSGKAASPPGLYWWPFLADVPMLATISEAGCNVPGCLVTASGRGYCSLWGGLAEVENVHAACLPAGDVACFLDIYGYVQCAVHGNPSLLVIPPPENEHWVEIVCASSYACARSTSGELRCFPVLDYPYTLPAQLSGKFSSPAAYHTTCPTYYPIYNSFYGTDRQRVCGIDAARRLQCMLAWKTGESEASKLVTLEPTRAWAAVVVTYDSVCAIPAD